MTDRRSLDPAPDLEVDLGPAARSYDVPGGDVDAVVRRGRQRVHRRHRALAGLSVVALVAATTAGLELLGEEPGTTVRSGAAVVRGDAGVVWRSVTPASGLGYASEVDPAAPLYALSTAPGQADLRPNAMVPRVVWRSDDGVEWTPVSTLGTDLFVSDLSARDGRVYAVGTGPATAAVDGRRPTPPLLVGWSDDGARTWRNAPLPLDLDAIAARTTRAVVTGTEVAAGPRGTVVVGVLDALLDVKASLPAGVSAPDGWAFTAAGVDLLGPDRGPVCPAGSFPPEDEVVVAKAPVPDPSGEVHPLWCTTEDRQRPVVVSPQDLRGVTASYSWAELGVDGDLLRAVRRQPVAFFAAPGSERFERVELPELQPVQGPVLVDAGDHGFDLVTTTGEYPPRGDAAANITVAASTDGRAWALSGALPAGELYAAAAGRVGGVVTIVAQRKDGAVVVRADGAGGWISTPLADAVDPEVRDGKDVHVVSAGVGPFGVVAAVAVASERGTADQRVLVSRDGRTWEDAGIEELAGRPVRSVIRAGVVGDRATVSVSVTPLVGDRPEQLVLVGAPS